MGNSLFWSERRKQHLRGSGEGARNGVPAVFFLPRPMALRPALPWAEPSVSGAEKWG